MFIEDKDIKGLFWCTGGNRKYHVEKIPNINKIDYKLNKIKIIIPHNDLNSNNPKPFYIVDFIRNDLIQKYKKLTNKQLEYLSINISHLYKTSFVGINEIGRKYLFIPIIDNYIFILEEELNKITYDVNYL